MYQLSAKLVVSLFYVHLRLYHSNPNPPKLFFATRAFPGDAFQCLLVHTHSMHLD